VIATRSRSIGAVVGLPALAILTILPAWGTTLQKLTLDDLITQSTAIVRVKVTGSSATLRGRDIYTNYEFQVLETLKGAPQNSVAVPGGVAGGLRQMVAGAPSLSFGGQYVIFMWTSRSGLTQVIGLSQGLFSVMDDSSGNPVLVRPAATGQMVDKTGNLVGDKAVTVSLSDLRAEIKKATGAGK
jgi:hypothetical protein